MPRSDSVSAAYVVGVVLVTVALMAVGFYCWTMLLEESSTRMVRLCLHVYVCLLIVLEILMWHWGSTKTWLFPMCMVVDIWGFGDSAMRFPVVHDIDTFFTFKLASLVVLKTVAFAFGFAKPKDIGVWYILLMFSNVWSYPLCYVLALPIGDKRVQDAKHDVEDVDLVLRLVRFATDAQHRQMVFAVW
eukprot:CAMPEP_0204334528 /NCGR_PEP_ID=MMETSP0469-20131031/18088_1 /ASSEMBLY_ACC=CAM_ASM_000384 /TAXON_ID=2969 /ORGANISM="Oxyrrhis marina" /LENGTH=187 /DNA_ID=CAMNT_0051318053 /DNA_START=20 /DNA_END=580 /DNA_ORIENTATION=-